MPDTKGSWLERAARVLERVNPAANGYLSVRDDALTGEVWAYATGTSGMVNIPAGGKVLQITAIAGEGGTHTIEINGGAAIPLPQHSSLTVQPRGNLVAPTVVFTGTVAYFVEYVT